MFTNFEWDAFLQNQMVPGERLISFVENLEVEFLYVPHIIPNKDYPAGISAVLALTNRRVLISYMWDIMKLFSFSSISSFGERKISDLKPKWPYQAIIIIPGGMGLVLQTKKVDKVVQDKLSSILVQAFMQFGGRGDDSGSITAIVAYEEEKERQRKHTSDRE